jgi:Asp-tRNA(Asn)/Glu-tRNA(Gln) amidotransferase A subunit family amidase
MAAAPRDPCELSASEARAALAAGELTAEQLVRACLARIQAQDADLAAFVHVDEDAAMAAARRCDQRRPVGGLHGIPFAVKDMIDTGSMPTSYNSPVYEGFRPGRDASCVASLSAQGAILLGKVATVEFASVGRIPPTRNPRDPARTPGGTSSGSAVAVATGMVPLALSTQTGGSTIRPASFCGVAALKPTFGRVSTDGVRPYAPSLDTVSWMARTVSDLALVAHAYRLVEPPAQVPETPRLRMGVCRTPYWSEAETASLAALEAASRAIRDAGHPLEEVDALDGWSRLNEAQDVVMHGEGRAAYLAEYLQAAGQLHPDIVAEVENAKGYSPADLRWAYDYLGRARIAADEALSDFDAFLTPAVPGEAPLGLDDTGLATFNRLWTALHVPCVTLPGFHGPAGLPVGIQLVARRYEDQALLAAAQRVEQLIAPGTVVAGPDSTG